jgi:phosphoheptose isomerase
MEEVTTDAKCAEIPPMEILAKTVSQRRQQARALAESIGDILKYASATGVDPTVIAAINRARQQAETCAGWLENSERAIYALT